MALTDRTSLLPSSSVSQADYGSISEPQLDSSNNTSIPAFDLPAFPAAADLNIDTLLEAFHLSRELTARQTALLLVACLRRIENRVHSPQTSSARQSVWNTWREGDAALAEVEQLSRLVLEIWELWIKDGRNDDDTEDPVELLLWTSVVNAKGGQRVIDFLPGSYVPPELLAHPIVRLSLLSTWSKGLHQHLPVEVSSLTARALFWLDSFSTPRLLHLHALLSRIVHVFLSLWLLLFPADGWGPWEIVWAAWTIGAVCELPMRPSSFRILTGLAFFAALPSPPLPSTFTFALLLAAFVTSILEFHLPSPPSPVLLSPLGPTMIVSNYFQELVADALLPSLTFFMPLMLASLVLLSISLSGEPWHPYYLMAAAVNYDVGPYETRVAILALIILSLITFLWLVIGSTMQISISSKVSSHRKSSDVIRTFVRVQLQYAFVPTFPTPSGYPLRYSLPPPVNLLALPVVYLPYAAMAVVPRLRSTAKSYKGVAYAILWRITVAPVLVVLSVFWAWEGRIKFHSGTRREVDP